MNTYVFNQPPLPPSQLVRKNAHKTAIHRKGPSVPGRCAIERHLPKLGFKSIIDWGCGRGRDVEYFKEQGLRCEGHDPHFFPDVPANKFDFATCSYVLNVIGSRTERKQCLFDVRDGLINDGHALITIRPASEIQKQAYDYYLPKKDRRRKHPWNLFSDGFVTTRGTFQTLMNIASLAKMVEECGFKVKHKEDTSNFVMVLAQKV